MTLRVSRTLGDTITTALADALDLGTDFISEPMIDVCRSFAFESEDVNEFRYWYLRDQCFSKFETGDSLDDLRKEKAAIAGFKSSEENCRVINGKFEGWESRCSVNIKLIRRARAIIARILGTFDINELPSMCGFGPGASGSLGRKACSQQDKWDLSSHITERALPYHAAFVKWSGSIPVPSKLLVVAGNRVTTVPKNWRKRRIIAIEPDWNMFYQKGVGAMIRRRLQRWKQLLPDAQERNRASACYGSATGRRATLDISGASDNVALLLVRALLSDEWFKVLYDLRSHSGTIGKGKRAYSLTYEKISSMGNGDTFELETLIFLGLTLAASSKENWSDVSVYGDDIICNTQDVEAVTALLNECGFTLNADKSFSRGPFRESCGGHYWYGEDVTPFYLKHHPKHVGDIINLANGIYNSQRQRGSTSFGEFTQLYSTLRRSVPRNLWGPLDVPGCLWRDWDECRPKWFSDYQSYKQETIARVTQQEDYSDRIGSYLHKLWVGVPDLESSYKTNAGDNWRTNTLYKDRESWNMLTVR